MCAKYNIRCEAMDWKWRYNGSAVASQFILAVNSLFNCGSSTEKILKEGLRMVLGNGRRIDFWRELGNDDLQLLNAFPRIFSLSSKKNGPVDSFGSWQGQVWVWDIPLRRPCFDWEKDIWNAFASRLEQFKPRTLFQDTIAWSFSPKGIFSVGSFRKKPEESSLVADKVDPSIV